MIKQLQKLRVLMPQVSSRTTATMRILGCRKTSHVSTPANGSRRRHLNAGQNPNEITMLMKSYQQTRDRLKSLKATKTDPRKRKLSSKAESNSSGRVRTATSSLAKTKKTAKVAMAAKIGSKKRASSFFFVSHSLVDNETSCSQVKKRLVTEWQFNGEPNCTFSDANRASGLGHWFAFGAPGW